MSASLELGTDPLARSVVHWTIAAQIALLVLDDAFDDYDASYITGRSCSRCSRSDSGARSVHFA